MKNQNGIKIEIKWFEFFKKKEKEIMWKNDAFEYSASELPWKNWINSYGGVTKCEKNEARWESYELHFDRLND